MNKLTKTLAFFTLVALPVFFLRCTKSAKDTAEAETHMMQEEDEPVPASEAKYKTEEVFRTQLTAVFKAYVALKDALVKGDLSAVKSAGQNMSEAIARTDHEQLKGPAHLDWNSYSEGLNDYLSGLAAASDITSSRNLLPGLTENMYNAIKAFGLNGLSAYYAYCPMAFNNRGGYWLSDEKKIRNPYFGDAMLECGRVREQLK